MWNNTKGKVLTKARENILQTDSNFTKWNLMHDDFTCLFFSACEIWNVFSRASLRNCHLVLLQLTNYKYIYSPWKVWKRMRYSWTCSYARFFFYWAVKITQFPDGFHLKLFNRVPLQLIYKYWSQRQRRELTFLS